MVDWAWQALLLAVLAIPAPWHAGQHAPHTNMLFNATQAQARGVCRMLKSSLGHQAWLLERMLIRPDWCPLPAHEALVRTADAPPTIATYSPSTGRLNVPTLELLLTGRLVEPSACPRSIHPSRLPNAFRGTHCFIPANSASGLSIMLTAVANSCPGVAACTSETVTFAQASLLFTFVSLHACEDGEAKLE